MQQGWHNLSAGEIAAMQKKYRSDCLDSEKLTFADLFEQRHGPSFADLEPQFQPASVPEPISSSTGDKRRTKGGVGRSAARIDPESQLDLHGMTAEQAETKTKSFLLTQKKRGRYVVRIITGKGLHSSGPGVLRDLVELILLEGREQGLLRHFYWEKKTKEQSGAVLVQLR